MVNTLGRTIRVFLSEGTPEGLRMAEIMNWTGKLFVFPRAKLPSFAQREESTERTGIYFLVGSDPDDPLQDVVYIGESEDILSRLLSHNRDVQKDFWTDTIVVISKDENLTKSHIRYLESCLITLSRDIGRAVVNNGTEPRIPPIPEPDVADMNVFLSQIQLLLPVLGFSFIVPLPTIPKPQSTPSDSELALNDPSPVFVLSHGGNEIATAKEVEASFIVQQGSKARTDKGAIRRSHQQRREQLCEDGTLKDTDDPEYWVFTRDCVFNSPSAAATVIRGYSTNGRITWKVKGTEQTYQDWQDGLLKKVIPDEDLPEDTVSEDPTIG